MKDAKVSIEVPFYDAAGFARRFEELRDSKCGIAFQIGSDDPLRLLYDRICRAMVEMATPAEAK